MFYCTSRQRPSIYNDIICTSGTSLKYLILIQIQNYKSRFEILSLNQNSLLNKRPLKILNTNLFGKNWTKTSIIGLPTEISDESIILGIIYRLVGNFGRLPLIEDFRHIITRKNFVSKMFGRLPCCDKINTIKQSRVTL